MKKLWLLSLFLIGLFLYWCWDNTEKNKMSEQEIFDNNLKCQEYMDKLKWDRYSSEEDGYKDSIYEYSVFYSPITNSCLWAFIEREINNWDDFEYSTEVSNRIVSLFWWESAWFTVRYNRDWSKYCYWATEFPWADDGNLWYNHAWWFWCNDGENPELADKAWEEEINRLKWN